MKIHFILLKCSLEDLSLNLWEPNHCTTLQFLYRYHVCKEDFSSGVLCVTAISKSLEPVTGQMSNAIAAKLTAVEGTLKENVIKVVKSKVCVA